MNSFRLQPILDVTSYRVTAVEILATLPLMFLDEAAMLAVDIAAMDYASRLISDRVARRVHINVELSTLVLAPWAIAAKIRPGIVVEVVERHHIIDDPQHGDEMYAWISDAIAQARNRGAKIAIDDASTQDTERRLIWTVKPDYIKLNFEQLREMRDVMKIAPRAKVIVERVETWEQAELARFAGANEIQGFWCDRLAALPALRLPDAIGYQE